MDVNRKFLRDFSETGLGSRRQLAKEFMEFPISGRELQPSNNRLFFLLITVVPRDLTNAWMLTNPQVKLQNTFLPLYRKQKCYSKLCELIVYHILRGVLNNSGSS